MTVGKDTTLRDFAQGCWRMRGLSRGQTVQVVFRNEVGNLVIQARHAAHRGTSAAPGARHDVVGLSGLMGWLVLNSMRGEATQGMALCMQVGVAAVGLVMHSLSHVAVCLLDASRVCVVCGGSKPSMNSFGRPRYGTSDSFTLHYRVATPPAVM